MLGLERFELVHERVVLGVGDFGRVHDVVEMLVAAQLSAQFVDALRNLACFAPFIHGKDYRGRHCMARAGRGAASG